MVAHLVTPFADDVDFVHIGSVSGRGGVRDTCFEMSIGMRCLVALAGGIPVYVVP